MVEALGQFNISRLVLLLNMVAHATPNGTIYMFAKLQCCRTFYMLHYCLNELSNGECDTSKDRTGFVHLLVLEYLIVIYFDNRYKCGKLTNYSL